MRSVSKRTEEAMQVALEAHKNQTRKSDGTPYVVHPLMCAQILTRHGFSEDVVAAALLHDTLEDTSVTEDMLVKLFGEQVTHIVRSVTENKTLPWEERKQAYVALVRESSVEVKAVCIADKIHNMQSLLSAYEEQGSSLWSKFNRGREKKYWFEELCLTMFTETWNHDLVDEYAELVEKMKNLP